MLSNFVINIIKILAKFPKNKYQFCISVHVFHFPFSHHFPHPYAGTPGTVAAPG